MKGIILAAGIGKRLKPLTKHTPKALIPICNKPMIQYVIEKYKNIGITDLAIVIRKENEDRFKNEFKKIDLKPIFLFQKSPKGTLDALSPARDFIGKETFILSWCDFISKFDFKNLIKKHQTFNPKATLLINKEEANSSGQVLFKGQFITKIIEKPKRKISSWVSAGTMVLDYSIFAVIEKIKLPLAEEYHIADVLQYWIDQDEKICFMKLDTWRVNVNTSFDIRKAAGLILASQDL